MTEEFEMGSRNAEVGKGLNSESGMRKVEKQKVIR